MESWGSPAATSTIFFDVGAIVVVVELLELLLQAAASRATVHRAIAVIESLRNFISCPVLPSNMGMMEKVSSDLPPGVDDPNFTVGYGRQVRDVFGAVRRRG